MKTIVFFILIITLISCKEKYHVSGRVFNPITNDGLSGVRVTFKKFGDFGVGTPSGYEEVASAFTDANGNYDLKSKKQASWVQIETGTDLYELGSLQNGTYMANVTVNKKENMIVNWHALPYGYVTTHTQNINCQGPSDSMQVRGKTDYTPYTSFGYIYRTGCYDNTSTTPSKVPMGFRYYETKVIRSGITTFVYDTIFVSEGGTSFLEILY